MPGGSFEDLQASAARRSNIVFPSDHRIHARARKL
jgi:hypothetical protein